MDQVRRLLKPVRLPIPPRPQASRARRPDACVRRPVAQPSGPRRTRTVTPLLAGKLHCHSCYGPNVRGAGVEPAVHNAPGLRPGTVPRWQPAVGIGKLVDQIPLLAISSVVKELFGREGLSPFRQIPSSHSQGRGESNPIVGGFGGRPATGASPLRLFSVVMARKPKEPPPCGSGSSTVSGPFKMQVMPLMAPPRSGLRSPCLGYQGHLMWLATCRATSPGPVALRTTGFSGHLSRGYNAWTRVYTGPPQMGRPFMRLFK